MNNLISEYNIMVHTIILSGGMRLFLYGKKIVYLSKYQDGKKEPGLQSLQERVMSGVWRLGSKKNFAAEKRIGFYIY